MIIHCGTFGIHKQYVLGFQIGMGQTIIMQEFHWITQLIGHVTYLLQGIWFIVVFTLKWQEQKYLLMHCFYKNAANLPKNRKHSDPTFQIQCTCGHDNQTNPPSWRINCKKSNLLRIKHNLKELQTTYWSLCGSLRAIFSKAFISSLAASRYFSTFLMIFNAMQ